MGSFCIMGTRGNRHEAGRKIGFVSRGRGTACRARTVIGFVLRVWVVGRGEIGFVL